MESLLRVIPAALVIFITIWAAIKMTTKIDAQRYWKPRDENQT